MEDNINNNNQAGGGLDRPREKACLGLMTGLTTSLKKRPASEDHWQLKVSFGEVEVLRLFEIVCESPLTAPLMSIAAEACVGIQV